MEESQKRIWDDQGNLSILNGLRCFYSKTDEVNFTPCMDILMNDPVDMAYLQSALTLTMKRFLVFRMTVVQSDETYYLKENMQEPIVHNWTHERPVLSKEHNNGYLIWIGVHGTHILVYFFHGLTDGRGIQPFVKCLLAKYCAMRYGSSGLTEIASSLIEKQDDSKECVDSLFYVDENQTFARQQQGKAVFHFADSQLSASANCFLYTIHVNANELDCYMRCNKSSRTAVFATFMSMGIADSADIGECTIKASIAADVRKTYGVENTLRECTGTIPLYYDGEFFKLPVQRQLQKAREMIISGLEQEVQLAIAAETKKNNKQLERKLPSLEAKKRFACRMHPYMYNEYTYAMSNIGKISFGQDVDQYVSSVKVITCANTYPVIIEIIQFQQTYNICYCSRIANDPYVHTFVDHLKQAGITCSCHQVEHYVEPLVVF